MSETKKQRMERHVKMMSLLLARYPKKAIPYILDYLGIKDMDDEEYIKLLFCLRNGGKKIDLKDPQTYVEKLNWLKIHDRQNIYTTMVDKYAVKKYVADTIGQEYIVPLIGVYDRFEEIDFAALPKQFVLKATHDCGGGNSL